MKKNITSIDYCAGMGWKKAEKWLKANAHMLALGEDADGLQVARAVTGSGAEAGTAVMAAFLALKENGIGRFVGMAVKIYRDISREILESKRVDKELNKRAKILAHKVHNLEYYTSFLGGVGWNARRFEWPVEMPAEMWADMGRRSGLANVMMGVAISKLSENVTTEFIAASQMAKFLKDGIEGKDA